MIRQRAPWFDTGVSYRIFLALLDEPLVLNAVVVVDDDEDDDDEVAVIFKMEGLVVENA
jgi:hypothetical protein